MDKSLIVTILPLIALLVTELLPMTKKTDANGILHGIGLIILKLFKR